MMKIDWTARREYYQNVYLHSRYWKWVHRLIARRAGYKCEVKGCKRYGPGLNAHHTVYILWREWLTPWKLIYLCPDHHSDTHRGITLQLKRRRWFIFHQTLQPYGGKDWNE